MMKQTLQYLEKLISIPSPTGYTREVLDYLYQTITKLGYHPIKTHKGGILVSVEGKETASHRFITAHIDTLGAMVKSITSEGRLKLALVGGFTWNAIEGENCLVHVANIPGKTISGTILLHQTSVHVYRQAGTIERNQDSMEVRLDEKVTTAQQVRELGIEVGDFVSFDPRYQVTESGFVKSRFLDDKISAAILLAQLQRYQENKVTLPYTTHFYFSNNEEIGYGGNSNIDSRVVEYLAVDMGALGDGQASDEYTVSICAKDSSGPYHFGLRQKLVSLAKEHHIPYKVDLYPYYGSDASAAMHAGMDVKHALIGSGVESSHSYERSHCDSIEATQRLIDVYLLSEMDA